ncbi:hypothetical protein PV410_25000 [Streptomyces sp. PA03-5A]|nr:hypothetical protein [Streptomyces sp. PA03-5A]
MGLDYPISASYVQRPGAKQAQTVQDQAEAQTPKATGMAGQEAPETEDSMVGPQSQVPGAAHK